MLYPHGQRIQTSMNNTNYI